MGHDLLIIHKLLADVTGCQLIEVILLLQVEHTLLSIRFLGQVNHVLLITLNIQ